MSWIIESLEKQLAEMQIMKHDLEREYIDFNASINALIAVIEKLKYHDVGVSELLSQKWNTKIYPRPMYIE